MIGAGGAGEVADVSRVGMASGNIYYVTKSGNDANAGKSPDNSLLTIAAGIAKLSPGDTIRVGAGTYAENGLDLNVASTKIIFDIGSIIAPTSGTAFTVSGNYCYINGNHSITPVAGQTGLLISGSHCRVNNGKVLLGGTGVKITGAGLVMTDYACGQQTAIAYDIQGTQARLNNCNTVGVGATIGYKISGGVDTGVINGCTSVGHETAGYYIDTGSKDWAIFNCASGLNDGKWRDIDSANEWANFSYNYVKTSIATLDASAETKSYSVARIYGKVKIANVHIEVLSALSANIRDVFLDIWDGAVSNPISKNTTLTLDAAPVGSLITRIEDSTAILDYKSGATCFITENSSYRSPQTEVIVGAKGDGTATYLRLTYTTSDTPSSGQIRGHIEWSAISDDGFVELL